MEIRSQPRGVGRARAQVEAARARVIGSFWPSFARNLGLRVGDQAKGDAEAERAQDLEAFVRGEPVPGVWPNHLRPIFEEAFDTGLTRVMQQELHPDALIALVTLARAIDRASTLSTGVLTRLTEAQLKRQAAVAAADEQRSAM